MICHVVSSHERSCIENNPKIRRDLNIMPLHRKLFRVFFFGGGGGAVFGMRNVFVLSSDIFHMLLSFYILKG